MCKIADPVCPVLADKIKTGQGNIFHENNRKHAAVMQKRHNVMLSCRPEDLKWGSRLTGRPHIYFLDQGGILPGFGSCLGLGIYRPILQVSVAMVLRCIGLSVEIFLTPFCEKEKKGHL